MKHVRDRNHNILFLKGMRRRYFNAETSRLNCAAIARFYSSLYGTLTYRQCCLFCGRVQVRHLFCPFVSNQNVQSAFHASSGIISCNFASLNASAIKLKMPRQLMERDLRSGRTFFKRLKPGPNVSYSSAFFLVFNKYNQCWQFA